MKRSLVILAAYAAPAFMSAACAETPNEDTPRSSSPTTTSAGAEVRSAEDAAMMLTNACWQWAMTRDLIEGFGPHLPTEAARDIGATLVILQDMAADTDIREPVFAFALSFWNDDRQQVRTYEMQLNETCGSFSENDSQTPVKAVESANAD